MRENECAQAAGRLTRSSILQRVGAGGGGGGRREEGEEEEEEEEEEVVVVAVVERGAKRSVAHLSPAA
jgi:hypothetical protein